MKKTLLFIFILINLMESLNAQVINDSVSYILELSLEKPLESFTDKSSVEFRCLNTKITSPCLKYHNDQWYFFIPNANTTYFVNIKNQHCRSTWGVQVVIIEGTICEPSTYRIKECISLGNQDDISIKMDGYASGKPYYVIIDGFLGDYCHFQIEYSKHAKGLVINSNEDIKLTSYKSEEGLSLKWDEVSKSDSLKICSYELLKSSPKNKRSILLGLLETRNAYGLRFDNYTLTDSTFDSQENVKYKLVAVGCDGTKQVVSQYTYAPSWKEALLRIRAKKGRDLIFNVYDQTTGSFLFSHSIHPGRHLKEVKLKYFESQLKGSQKLRITFSYRGDKKKKSIIYDVIQSITLTENF